MPVLKMKPPLPDCIWGFRRYLFSPDILSICVRVIRAMAEEKEEETTTAPDITSLDTYVLLGLFINILSAQAWQHMGLRLKPGANNIEKDLKRANTAIDCIAFLVNKLEPEIPENERRQLRNLLTDLQVNFVQVKG